MAWPWRRERPGVERIDRLIVQQYDAQRTLTIGGIDTCLRGVLEYAPPDVTIGVVGVRRRLRRRRAGPVAEASAGASATSGSCPVARIDTTRPKGVVPYSVAAHRRPAAVPGADPAGGVAAGAPGGRRARRPACCSAARSCTASTPRSAACSGRRPTRSGGSRRPPRAAGPLDRAAGRAGDRVQPGVRREGAAVEPAHRRRAHVVRPRDHRPRARPAPARAGLGGPAGDPEGPRARHPDVRRAREGATPTSRGRSR